MIGFLTGIAAMVIISAGAAIYFETMVDYSSQERFTSPASVRLDDRARD